MKILFTGASSLTGMWFVKELVASGHEITAIFRQPLESYTGLRRQRINQLVPLVKPVFCCSFGDPQFLDLVKSEPWDRLCHHGSDVTDYKSAAFDYLKALASNTCNLKEILNHLKKTVVVLTGTVFEQNEGAGSDDLRAVSAYGLSKGLTSDVFKFLCQAAHVPLAKFVIANPFGPFEEPRFTTYLIEKWVKNTPADVRGPAYIRDNIHATLLAKSYRDYVERHFTTPFTKINPSAYVESQGLFTTRFANEMRKRLNLPCEFILHPQTDFPEPQKRINTDPVDVRALGWNETKAWDDLADYYQSTYQSAAVK
jgi:nucleoside-diphosphate-sugar epimerase